MWGRSVMTSSTQSRRPCPCWADGASACTALFQHRLRISETVHCAAHLALHVWSPAGCVLAICSWAAKHAGSDSCLQFKRCAETLPTGATGAVWFFKFCPSSYLPWWVFCITIRSIMYVLCTSYVCLMYVLCMSMYYVLSIFVLCFVPWMVSLSSISFFAITHPSPKFMSLSFLISLYLCLNLQSLRLLISFPMFLSMPSISSDWSASIHYVYAWYI